MFYGEMKLLVMNFTNLDASIVAFKFSISTARCTFFMILKCDSVSTHEVAYYIKVNEVCMRGSRVTPRNERLSDDLPNRRQPNNDH